MKSRAAHPLIDLLLANLQEAYDRKAWHGTNLRGSIRSVTAAEAAWRPAPGRHNIAELVVHAAYWKYAVWRALTGAKRGSFPHKGSNWFARDAASDADWSRDLALLGERHRELLAAVTAFDPKKLSHSSGRRYTYSQLISGAAAHDLYHAGQIQMLKRLQNGKKA